MRRPFSLLCAGLTLFVSVFGVGEQAWAQREVIQHQPYVDLRKYYLGFRLGMHAPDLRITNRGYMTPEGRHSGPIPRATSLALASGLSVG